MLIHYFCSTNDIRLLKSDTYVSTHIPRYSEGFHIQLVFKFGIVITLHYTILYYILGGCPHIISCVLQYINCKL